MDIRDLVVEDELFDPLADEDEGLLEPDAGDGEEPELPLIGEAMEEREEPEEDTRPPRQRIYELLGQMPGQKRVLLAIVDYCREEKTGEEMDSFTEELQADNYSVYTPVILRELLEGAGAIEYIVEENDGDESEETSGEADAQDAATADKTMGERADEAVGESAVEVSNEAEAAAAAETEAADSLSKENDADNLFDDDAARDADMRQPGVSFLAAAIGMPAEVAGDVQHEVWESDGEDIDIEYLEIEPQQPGVWKATPEGLEIVDEQDDFGAIKRLLGKEPQYQDIYQRILDFCKDEGRSAKELDNLVNDDPILETPRRYSGYFVGRLEREGAIRWSNGWVLTQDGAKILRSLVEEAATAGQM